MPIPRYIDEKTGEPFDLSLFCHKCGWAVAKDKRSVTTFKVCALCGGPLKTLRVDYPGATKAAA